MIEAQTVDPHSGPGGYGNNTFDKQRGRSYDIVEMLRGDTLVKVSAPMVRYSK